MTQAKAVFPVRNPAAGKCWGSLSRCFGFCAKNARPGKLTCWHHARAEEAAQRLKKRGESCEEVS